MSVELTTAAGSADQPRPLVLKPGSAETDIDAAFNKIKIHDNRELPFDENGDGMLDEAEILQLIQQKSQGDRTIAHMTKGLVIMGALLVVFFGITIGSVVHSVNVASEDQAKVSGTNELVAAGGTTIALTAVAVEDAPLYIIPVLPDDVIKRMDSITVSIDFNTASNTSAAPVTAFPTGLPPGFNIASMNYTFNVASFAKVNSTCAILSSDVGDVLFLNAGQAVLTFGAASPFSGVFGVCSASASCSRTSVSGIDIAGYARAADAALMSAGIDVHAGGGRQRRQRGPWGAEPLSRLCAQRGEWPPAPESDHDAVPELILGNLTIETDASNFASYDHVRHISGTLFIRNSGNVSDISGFKNLQSVGGLDISYNANVRDISGFNNLQLVDDLRISENGNSNAQYDDTQVAPTSSPTPSPMSYSIGLPTPSPTPAPTVVPTPSPTPSPAPSPTDDQYDYNARTSITGFSNLRSVRKSLFIFSNIYLDTISGFGGLLTVGGKLRISNNGRRRLDFTPLQKLKCHGGVYDDDNNNTQQYCTSCPQWLLNLPEC